MDRTTLVGVNLGCGWLFDDLNGSQLSWLLVVFDLWADLQIQLPTESIVKMSEELSLENAIDERIRFLSADDEREPVIPVVGSTDGFDGSDRDGFLRGNYELIVHEVLGYNVYMSVCQNENARQRFA